MASYTISYTVANSKQNTQDGIGTYSGAHDATTSTVYTLNSGINNILHNSLIGGNYFVRRADLQFDTSAIGAGETITSAILRMRGNSSGGGNADTDTIVVLNNTDNASLTNPVISEDMDDYGSTSIGSAALSLFTNTGSDADITLTDYTAINKGGVTRLGLRLQKDIDNTSPSGANVLRVDTSARCDLIIETAPPTDVKNSSLATNLVSYWELEEASGTRVDSHGSNDLTDNNTVLSATGIQGDGADFESSLSEWLSLASLSGTGLDITGSWSAAFWYKPESVFGGNGVDTILAITGSGGVSISIRLERYLSEFANNIVCLTFGTSGLTRYKSSTQLSAGTWYHVAVTHDVAGSSMSVYINGSEVGIAVNTTSTTLKDTSGPFNLGRDTDSTSSLDGILDEVGVWDRIITASDVTSLYNSGAGLPYEVAAPTGTFSLTVNASKVAATLTDYPGYVDLSEMPAAFWAEVTSGGGDIRCYSDSGLTTELAREIVSCDTVTDTGEMHVKVPSLTTSSVIYVTVDGTSTEPAVTATYGRNAVWTGYDAVFHMNEDPSGTAPQLTDSTGNGNNGTSEGSMTSGDLVTGQIGDGTDFDGSNDGYNLVENGTLDATSDITISMWANTDGTGDSVQIAKRDSSNYSWEIAIRPGSYSLFRVNSNTISASGGAVFTNNTWQNIHATYDSSNIRLYRNGAQVGSRVYTTAISTNNVPVSIAHRNFTGAETFSNSILDEIRISLTTKSANWISTEYNNQSDVATFWTIAEEGGGGGGVAKNAVFFGGGM